MRLVTFTDGGSEELGIICRNDQIFTVSALMTHTLYLEAGLPVVSSDLNDVFAKFELEKLATVAKWLEGTSAQNKSDLKSDGVVVNPESVEFCAPITRPSLILAQGLAYKAHLKEMGVPHPKTPVSFVKASSSLTGTECPIIMPPDSPDMIDWEGEFCFVIGKPCYRVSESEAMAYVAGYTIINDVSARDWVGAALNPDQKPMRAVMSWGVNIQGKQFPTFTPMGPVFVSADEIADPHDLVLETKVNGEVMQKANTGDLIFSISQAVSYFSQWYKFLPGDVISTGSPAGVGQGRTPKIYLKEGDVVEVSVSGIGTLRNVVQK